MIPVRRIRHLMETTPWERFGRAPETGWQKVAAGYRIMRHGGANSLDYARSWLSERMREAGLRPTVTFAGLLKAKRRRLVIAATRYSDSDGWNAQPFIFDPETSGDAPVVEAVAASMAVQFFYRPAEVAGWYFGDGGVALNHPIEVFALRPPETVLGVRVDAAREIAIETGQIAPKPKRPGFWGILQANTGLLRHEANRGHVSEELWKRIIRIDVGASSGLDFTPSPERFVYLRGCGNAALTEFLLRGEEQKAP